MYYVYTHTSATNLLNFICTCRSSLTPAQNENEYFSNTEDDHNATHNMEDDEGKGLIQNNANVCRKRQFIGETKFINPHN